ncbi:hypothetical protein [uncultured Tissierella sp.]|uniref:hypothetical protein n=1 Tax=uncultured Tissierella sp. TaxID=448160 RepID=UPI0028062234|nr:hypothetical protein [uncultured Tissierella sp.]MDU5081220.1 hypothetical protein [Bacillota bacterium]
MILNEFKKDIYSIKDDLAMSLIKARQCIDVDELQEFELAYNKVLELLEKAKIENKKIILELESLANFIKICAHFNYPPYYTITLEQMKQISDMYSDFEKDKLSIEERVDNFFLEKCDVAYIRDKLYLKWKNGNKLSKRLKILDESIQCFEKGFYAAAIPLLFSQLEGMIADVKHTKGKMTGRDLKGYINSAFNTDLSGDISFEDFLRKMYEEEIMVGFKHKEELNSNFGRHAIMHGRDVDYGTQQNYIKLILFFDSVYERLIGSVQRKNWSSKNEEGIK